MMDEQRCRMEVVQGWRDGCVIKLSASLLQWSHSKRRGRGVKCYKCNAGGEYKCVRIVWRLFRSVRLCEFDGSGVCSEPLLTSAAEALSFHKGVGGGGLGSTPWSGFRVRTSIYRGIYRGNLKDAQLFHLILCCAAKCVTVSH